MFIKISANFILIASLFDSGLSYARDAGDEDWSYEVVESDSFERVYQKHLVKCANSCRTK